MSSSMLIRSPKSVVVLIQAARTGTTGTVSVRSAQRGTFILGVGTFQQCV